jgi:WD40 repeat protein
VAAASHAGVQVWNAATGETRFPEVQLPGWTEAIAFSLDGKFLAAAGGAYERDVPRLLVTDLATLASARPLSGHKADIGAVAFSPDSRLLASSDEDGTLILWDTQTWAPATALETDLEPGILKQPIRLAFSPDGKWLASSGGRNQVLVIDPLAGKVAGEFTGHQQCISALAFTPDGQQVASADFVLSLWTVSEGQVTQQFANPLGGRIEAVAIHPSGQFIAWADAGTEIYLNRLTGVGPRPVSRTPPQRSPERTAEIAEPTPSPETATAPAEPALRFWSDRSGRYRVKAVLVKIAGDQVTLRREDGKVVTLQATLLSDEDQQYLDTRR